MTVGQFLTLTSSVPTPVLRQAMIVALAVEPADGPEAYSRFYYRVLGELGLANRTDCGSSTTQPTELVASGPQARRDPPRSAPIARAEVGAVSAPDRLARLLF